MFARIMYLFIVLMNIVAVPFLLQLAWWLSGTVYGFASMMGAVSCVVAAIFYGVEAARHG